MITSKAFEKFEKWPSVQKTEFVLAFMKVYNEAHGTNFELTEDSLKDNQDYDFSLRQKDGRVLKVQHTSAGAEAEKEYIRPKSAEAIISDLKKRLNDLKGLLVIINIHNPPKSDTERGTLIFGVEGIIREKDRKANRPSLFTYDEHDEPYLEKIKPWVDHLEIRRVEDLPIVAFWYESSQGSCLVIRDDHRVDMALGRKAKRYSNPEDLVIIVHFNTTSCDGIFLPMIQNQHASQPFQGIWLYDDFTYKFTLIK